MIFQCCVYILESFITVFYDPWKHSGNIAWKVINCTTKVYFFDKGDGWNLFKWKKNIKKKDFNLTYGGWNGQKIEQDFIFNVIIPARYTFQWKCYNLS